MRNLIQNERLKLYKKASTWVLVGIVLGLSIFSLVIQGVISHLEIDDIVGVEESTVNWQQEYKSQITSAYKVLKENPKDGDAKAAAECYQYLLNNQIDPSHWKYGLVMTHKDNLASLYSYEADPQDYLEDTGITEADMEQTKQTVATEKRLLQANDWREYVRLQMDEVQNGNTSYTTPEEKQVEMDILRMYLDLNIQPYTSGDTGSYYFPKDDRSWQQLELDNLRANKLALLRNESDYTGVLTATQRAQRQDQIALSIERLKTDTAPVESDSLYGMMESSLSSTDMLTILLIVLAGGIVANEFAAGTIKLLLITPHKRQSVFWAKVTVLVETTLMATGALFVLQFLISGLFGGFGSIGDMYLTPLFGSIVRIPYILVMLYKYLLFLLPVWAWGSLALMLSTVTRKAAVAIAVSMLLMYGGDIVNSIIAAASSVFLIPGAQFLLFTNTNLNDYFVSTPTSAVLFDMVGMESAYSTNLIFSVVILIVYTACFLWIARDSFCRRDVK